MRLRLLTLLCTLSLFKANAITYYVNASATGNGTGLSWDNAFTDLQNALSIAVYGDEIWVAAGQYKPTASATRTVSFVLKDGVNVRGGFAGTETSVSQRNIAANPTTLNGDIGEIGETSDNSHNIIRASGLTTTVILDGFRIINGNSGSSYNGAGLKVSGAMSGMLHLQNCYFFANKASNYGGALYIQNSKVTVEDCEFRGNNAGNQGGAIYTLNSGNQSTLIIKGTKFIGNSAYLGACVSNASEYKVLSIDRCIFTNNTSRNSIIDIDHFLNAKIYNSYIIGNTVNDFSANILAVSHYANSTADDFEMVNCTVVNNYNIYTNGVQQEIIDLYKSYYKIRNCIIYGNTAYQGRQLQQFKAVSNSIVEGGYANNSENSNAIPLFVNANTTATANFDATNFNYELTAQSPGINAGNNAYVNNLYPKDLNNAERLQGTIVDLGAYESDVEFTAVASNFNALSITAYPNPFITDLFITVAEQPEYAHVYDVSGRLVATPEFTLENGVVKLNLQGVKQKGIYILKLFYKEKEIVKKIIKQ
ncbi:T9SS type A sorting domain-containing protein [Flavobacterium psychrotrophum]|uniref:T9SS type A sorting domain-containing protein n=1 Tax=Flavobacterium psychrotrophum TaxID=2294119 RepID=UPI000E30FBBC|nr:T9SS type A sorting domain-containing protein [Flavobacterium psychrotrophum]